MLKELAFSTKSDVWSFGVVLFELATDGSMPFVEIDSIRVKELVLAGGHVTMPATHSALRNTAFECFKKSPSARPSFAQLEALLYKAKEGARNILQGGEVQHTPDLAPLDDMLDAEAPPPVAEVAPRSPSPTQYKRLKSPGIAGQSPAALPLETLVLASPRSTSTSGLAGKVTAAKPRSAKKKSSIRRSLSQSATGPLPIYATTQPRHGRSSSAAAEDKSKLNHPGTSHAALAHETAPRSGGGDDTDAAVASSAARSFVV